MNYDHIRDRLDPIHAMLQTTLHGERLDIDVLYQAVLMACDEAYIAGEINAKNNG